MQSKYKFLKERFAEWLRPHQGVAVVAVSPENVLHTSGAYIASQRMIRDRLAMTIYPVEGEAAFLVGDVVHRTAKADSWIEDTRAYTEHHQTPMQGLAEILREQGLAQGRIALETRYMPAESYLELVRELPDAVFFDAEEILNDTRMIKSDAEIGLMRRNAVAAEKAIEYGYLFSKPGDTERAVVARMRRALLELGGEWNPFITLAAGVKNTLEGHHVAGSKPILPGEILRVDMVGFWRGYYTDFARMAVVEGPDENQQEVYRKVIDVQSHVMEAARPGVRACDLYQDCVDYSQQIGMSLGVSLIGHSLGIGLHEYPVLGPTYEKSLAANMTLCIEIASKVPDLGMFHVEDLILVKEDGSERLTDHIDTSEMLVIR
jgi:Xaa-Pro aminopeptidase